MPGAVKAAEPAARACSNLRRDWVVIRPPVGCEYIAFGLECFRGGCVRLVPWILCAVLATAQEDHSLHQHAVAGLGTGDFPASCNATAQKLISRGAALLHSFGYEEARMTFGDAAQADPKCAMAWWGVARTWYHPIWAPPSADELKQGALALDRALALRPETGRERDYIDSLAVFFKDWPTVDHVTRAKRYEQALA